VAQAEAGMGAPTLIKGGATIGSNGYKPADCGPPQGLRRSRGEWGTLLQCGQCRGKERVLLSTVDQTRQKPLPPKGFPQKCLQTAHLV